LGVSPLQKHLVCVTVGGTEYAAYAPVRVQEALEGVSVLGTEDLMVSHLSIDGEFRLAEDVPAFDNSEYLFASLVRDVHASFGPKYRAFCVPAP
jgi:hypothetical protein